MRKNLKLWIAQSESWHTFVDFRLPEEAIAKYPFLDRADDFYIALFCKFISLLNDPNFKDKKRDLLAIGKGLEIYSLENTKNKFRGVNHCENILFAASLYYLADFSASAWLLAKLYSVDQYSSEIDKFISCFLRRNLKEENTYVSSLRNYLESGDISILEEMQKTFSLRTEEAIVLSPEAYLSYKLAGYLIERFYNNNLWIDLLRQDHHTQEDWKKYVEINLKRRPPIWDFFPSQREAINRGILKENKSFSFQMPTSSGKTALCELIIYNEKIKNPTVKILFLAPFRALASELKSGFSKKLSQLGIKTKTIYGGNIATQDEKNAIQKVDLLVSTPEKFLAMESLIPDIYGLFQVIICDEGHLLDNEQRGLSYELLLSKFRGSTACNMKFIFLSAIIPNLKDINIWLGGDDASLIQSDYRPTELNFAFLKKSGNAFLLDVNPTKAKPENYLLNNFLTRKDFQYINPDTKQANTYSYSTQKVISVAVSLKAVPSGTVALFTPQKGKLGVSGLAEEIIIQADTLSLPDPRSYSDTSTVAKLRQYFEKLFGEEYLLTKLIEWGAVFHHGDLPQDVREVIEDSLRDGSIRLVICTNTLAEGVNLPIKTIVIHSAKRYHYALNRRVDMDIRDLKNIAGRAGRAGKETKGLIIAANPNDYDLLTKLINDEGSKNITGSLYKIVLAVAKFIRKTRQPLSNEIFDKQEERFKQLIDSIDISLISLMAEEIEPEKLKEQIKILVEQTFAFQQATNEEKEALYNIFNLRGDVLLPYVESKEYRTIKKSGASVRLYKNILDLMDFGDDLWEATDNPLTEEWLHLIRDAVLSLPQPKFSMEEFNKYNKIDLSPDDIIEIIKLWIEGHTYKEIADKAQIEVDVVLKLFSSLIGFQLHSIISCIIRTADDKLLEKDKRLSETLSSWPQYLLYGLKKRLELDLIELGFTNRLGIMALCAAIEDENFTYSEIKQLRGFIKKNSDRLLARIREAIPEIAYEKIKASIDYLHRKNIY
jgi:replicative superfamily II helicase